MYRLIVVDDEEGIRNGIANFFPWNQIGYEVVGAFANGKLALDFLLLNPVDVVLCDVRMPVMTGIELAKEIYERSIGTKIIFLSAYQDFSYLQQSIIYGARNYILKPTKYDNLVDVFSKITEELDSLKTSAELLPAPMNKSESERLIESLKQYIRENLRDCGLNALASHAHLSPTYLSSLFKKTAGVNFMEYILAEKMNLAERLLAEGTHKINVISDMVGYNDTKNFIRAFRKYHGQSPGKFKREQARSGLES